MKTVSDISAFLKRNDNFELKVMHDGKTFIVKHGDMSSRSQYLDDALENIAEETRRRANGMQAVRETATNTSSTWTVPKNVAPSIMCSTCNTTAGVMMTTWSGSAAAFMCICGTSIYRVFSPGERFSVGRDSYEFNGSSIVMVAP